MGRIFRQSVSFGTAALIPATLSAAVVAVGAGPTAVNTRTGRVYAPGYGRVSVVDGVTDTVVAEISGDLDTQAVVAVGEANNRIYAALERPEIGGLSIIDGASNTVVGNIPLSGESSVSALALDGVTQRLYVARDCCVGVGNGIDVVDISTATVVGTISFPQEPTALAVDPARNRLYVGLRDGTLGVIDTTIAAFVDSVPLHTYVWAISIDTATQRVFVGGNAVITVIDANSSTVLGRINKNSLGVAQCCTGYIDLDSTTRRLFTDGGYGEPRGPKAGLLVIDADSLQLVRAIGGYVPEHTYRPISVDSRRGRVYVSYPSYGTIGIFLENESLLNGSFEERSGTNRNLPAAWTKRGIAGPADGRSSDAYDDRQSFHITGAPGAGKSLRQEVAVAGPAGSVVHAEAFSKSVDATATGGPYALVFRIYYDDGTQRTWHRPFTSGTHDWERRAVRVVADKPFSRMSVRLLYDNQGGETWFDAAHLWIDTPRN